MRANAYGYAIVLLCLVLISGCTLQDLQKYVPAALASPTPSPTPAQAPNATPTPGQTPTTTPAPTQTPAQAQATPTPAPTPTHTQTPPPTQTPAPAAQATPTPTPAPLVDQRLCGNGELDETEQCDVGARFVNGRWWPAAAESCPNGQQCQNCSCVSGNRHETCGDCYITDAAHGGSEECDVGNNANYCRNTLPDTCASPSHCFNCKCVGGPTPTPTATPSPTPTPAQTATPTPTPTPTPGQSATPTPTPGQQATPTPTPTPAPGQTPTPTPAPTPAPTVRTCTDYDWGYGADDVYHASYVRDSLNGVYANHEDYCEGSTLYEYRCNDVPEAEAYPFQCAYGCTAGACNPPPTPTPTPTPFCGDQACNYNEVVTYTEQSSGFSCDVTSCPADCPGYPSSPEMCQRDCAAYCAGWGAHQSNADTCNAPQYQTCAPPQNGCCYDCVYTKYARLGGCCCQHHFTDTGPLDDCDADVLCPAHNPDGPQ